MDLAGIEPGEPRRVWGCLGIFVEVSELDGVFRFIDDIRGSAERNGVHYRPDLEAEGDLWDLVALLRPDQSQADDAREE